MTLTTVNDRGLTTPIDLLDSEKIRFGTGDDLQIYHSGSHAYITNTTNSLLLESGSTVLRSPSQENYLVGTLNGSVDLYFDNVKKIESTSGGAQIVNGTGNTQLNIRGGSSDGTATIQFIADDNAANNDNFRLQNGASNDFYLQNYASGSWETNIKAVGDGAVELYHNGTKKLETTADGVKLPVSGADKKSSIQIDGTNGSSEIQGVILESDGENAKFHIKTAAGGGTPSDKFTINAISGNCGIGTDSPDTLLDVSSSDDAVVRIQSEGSDATDDARLEIKTTNGTFTIQNDRSIGTSGALTFAGNTSDNLVIDHDSGNCGLGISSPTEKLHVIGQVGGTNPTAGSKWDIARFVAHDYSTTNSGGLTIGAYWNNSTSSGRTSYIQSSQNTNSGSTARHLLLNPDGGNIGIGITAPDALLHLSGTSPFIRFTDTVDSSHYAHIGHTDASVFVIDADAANTHAGSAIQCNVDNTERLRIGSYGETKISCNKGGDYGLHVFNDGDNTNRYGILIQCGKDNNAGTNYALGVADGDAGTQGYLTFNAGTLSLVAFTASHPCIIPDADNPSDSSMAYPYGTLLETISIQYSQKNGADTERGIRYKVQKTQSANSRKVLGAYAGSMNGGPEGQTNEHDAYVLGDGHILVNNAGGNIEVGDGICSSATAGIGQKATANPSMIIGIAQEAITFTGSETKLVAVQYGLQQFIPWT